MYIDKIKVDDTTYDIKAENSIEIVSEIPSVDDAKENVVYYVDSNDEGTANIDIENALSSVMRIGMIVPFAGNGNIPSGFLLCNGASVSRATYPALFNVIGTTYGSVDDEHFNLPDLSDKFIEGGSSAGTEKEAGLPNITGSAVPAHDSGYCFHNVTSTNGAFYSGDSVSNLGASSVAKTYTGDKALYLDASRSSSIYGKSTTVQPPALTMRYIIKAFAGASEDSTDIAISNVANDLNNKLSLSGGTMTGPIKYSSDTAATQIGSYGIYYSKYNNIVTVLFKGIIVDTSTGAYVTQFTLPNGFRPYHNIVGAIALGGNANVLGIINVNAATGEVSIYTNYSSAITSGWGSVTFVAAQ